MTCIDPGLDPDSARDGREAPPGDAPASRGLDLRPLRTAHVTDASPGLQARLRLLPVIQATPETA